jgi:UrcA family protein
MTSFVTKVLLAGALAGFAAAAGAASVDSDAPSLVVHYNSDVLATDSGARALYHRIAMAAEQVCPAPSNSRIVAERVVKCREQAVAGAVGRIHNQRLAAVYASHSKAG